MAAQGTPEQQAIMALQAELAATRQQIAAVSHEHETLKRAHEALNNAAQAAFNAKANEITQLETKCGTSSFGSNLTYWTRKI